MAEAVGRKCRSCGRPTEAVSITLGKIGRAGRKTEVTRHVGGDLCDECSARQHEAAQAELTAAKLDDYRQWALIPARYRDLDYSGFTATEAVAAAKAWAAGQLKALCLCGDAGVGKTWLAGAAIADMMARRAAEDAAADLDESHDEVPKHFRPVRWATVSGLMADLKRSFSDDERAAAVRVIAGSCAIVLDDLDKVNPTEHGKDIIFATINARLEADKPLLVTTNLAPGQLGEKLGKPVMSRIAGDCLVVKMVGPDRRVSPVHTQAARAA